MKSKVLSLLLCFTIIFASFSTTVAVADTGDLIPGDIVVEVYEVLPMIDSVGDFELYGVVFSRMSALYVSEDFAVLLLTLPEGANSQEETEEAIAILNANPEVINAEQHTVGYIVRIYKIGDVNGDRVHDTTDYTLIKRAAIGTYTFNDKAMSVADINDNGKVDTHDYILAKRSAMKTYNIQLPMDTFTEEDKASIIRDYLDYMAIEKPNKTYTEEDVYIDETAIYGPYGDYGVYVVKIYNRQIIHAAEITRLELGERTLEFSDGNIPYVWTGYAISDLEEEYEYGFFGDIDLEDLETRYNIED